MMDIHMDFMNDLRNREKQKAETFEFAEEIILKAYPDAIPIIKNWLNLEREKLPDEIPALEKLIEDHKEFMENTAKRQSE
ncbi:hypothetical protein EVAR_66929_1 [Eumeta japonica]|uniref:Uncharacterized protein n=1 Tax=Eumeta variegata TaxID=151549 RepID=A0A4C2A3P2_EUMVA|nr:hypothetical protein EVAR_66929_1 [Eumeta japonica]